MYVERRFAAVVVDVVVVIIDSSFSFTIIQEKEKYDRINERAGKCTCDSMMIGVMILVSDLKIVSFFL